MLNFKNINTPEELYRDSRVRTQVLQSEHVSALLNQDQKGGPCSARWNRLFTVNTTSVLKTKR